MNKIPWIYGIYGIPVIQGFLGSQTIYVQDVDQQWFCFFFFFQPSVNSCPRGDGLHPSSHGLQHKSDDLQPNSNGLQPRSLAIRSRFAGRPAVQAVEPLGGHPNT